MPVRIKYAPRAEVIAISAASLAFGFVFAWPLLGHYFEAGIPNDWSFSLDFSWIAWNSIAHFHQLPLWNPYKCGGIPLLADPQSRVLTPFFLLHLLLEPAAGLHLEIPLHLAIAFGGGYALARATGLGPLAGVAAALTFAGSSWFSLHISEGHTVFLSSAYLPWICLFFVLSVRRKMLSYAAVAGALIALTFGEGGLYPSVQAGMLLMLLAIPSTVTRRSAFPILALSIAGGFALGFAAVKLLASIQMMSGLSRPGFLDSNTWNALATALFRRDQDHDAASLSAFGFWEYGSYISPLMFSMALGGAAVAYRRSAPWLIAACAFVVMAHGASSAYAPYALLHRLPVFSSTYLPSRYLIPLVLTVAMLAGFGIEALWRSGNIGKVLALIMVTASAGDLFVVSSPNFRHINAPPPRAYQPSPVFRQIYDPDSGAMLVFNQANLGAIHCYEFKDQVLNFRALGFNQPGYRGEQFLLGAGTATLRRWTPNALTFAVNVPSPTILAVNQNYWPGWRVVKGKGDIIEHQGLLAVRIPAGDQQLEIAYRNPLLPLGLAITLVTLLMAIILWRRDSRSAETVSDRDARQQQQ